MLKEGKRCRRVKGRQALSSSSIIIIFLGVAVLSGEKVSHLSYFVIILILIITFARNLQSKRATSDDELAPCDVFVFFLAFSQKDCCGNVVRVENSEEKGERKEKRAALPSTGLQNISSVKTTGYDDILSVYHFQIQGCWTLAHYYTVNSISRDVYA